MIPPGTSKNQHGIALLGLLFVATMLAAGLLISAWNAQNAVTGRDAKTFAALQQAKEAIIGYAAAHKTLPGYLSCPEQLSASSPTEGQANTNCSGGSNVIGRFPWRSLKLDRLTDGSGEPLWYAVSSGFGSSSVITNNSTGNISVDGAANAAVAVIIAPGPALPGQSRTLPSPATPPQPADYLDLSNASPGASSYVSTGAGGVFNDQIITISKAELLNAVNRRILAEISGSLTANGVLQYYNDNGGVFPPSSTPLSALPFDTDTRKFLTPWFSLATYTYTAPAPPQLSLGGTTLVITKP